MRSVVACSSCSKAQPAHGHAACLWLIQWLPAHFAGHDMLQTLFAAVWLLVTVQAVGAGWSMSGLLLAHKQMAARQG